MNKLNCTQLQQLERIARDALGVETLLPRNRDSLDFYDLHVANLRDALEQAYAAGARSAK